MSEWDDAASRDAWKASHGFQEGFAASKALCDEFIGGTTYLMTFPERGLVVAVMTNISFADTKSIALRIAEAFAAAPPAG